MKLRCIHFAAWELPNGLSWSYILENFARNFEPFHFAIKSHKRNGHFTWTSICKCMQLQCTHMSTYHLSDLMRISKESSASAHLSSHAQDAVKFRLFDRKLVFYSSDVKILLRTSLGIVLIFFTKLSLHAPWRRMMEWRYSSAQS